VDHASCLQIQGSKKLTGEITIAGAKNAALPILCACLLTNEPLLLGNVPMIGDIITMLQLLEEIGVNVKYPDADNNILVLTASSEVLTKKYDLRSSKSIRASILLLGPLIANFGKATLALPGGCAIGSRPIDQHIKGLVAMGAEIDICANSLIHAKAKGRLQGCSILTDMPTVTGTENLLMAAALARGITVLENAAIEPEVSDLAEVLIKMGAKIHGVGTNRLVIEGVNQLHGTTHNIMPDRIEAGTFLCAVAMTGGDITLRDCRPNHLDTVIVKLREAGLQITTGNDWIRAVMTTRPHAVSISTAEYPGFPTDLQAQFVAMNTISTGCAYVTENIFENRFQHIPELCRLGASITIKHPTSICESIDGSAAEEEKGSNKNITKTKGSTALIEGVTHLSGTDVYATDLRASASLILATLAAEGISHVHNIHHLDRGYDRIDAKLSQLGASILRKN